MILVNLSDCGQSCDSGESGDCCKSSDSFESDKSGNGSVESGVFLLNLVILHSGEAGDSGEFHDSGKYGVSGGTGGSGESGKNRLIEMWSIRLGCMCTAKELWLK